MLFNRNFRINKVITFLERRDLVNINTSKKLFLRKHKNGFSFERNPDHPPFTHFIGMENFKNPIMRMHAFRSEALAGNRGFFSHIIVIKKKNRFCYSIYCSDVHFTKRHEEKWSIIFTQKNCGCISCLFREKGDMA